MNVGLYQGAASMQALEQWQAAVSQNLASASVPGYKKVETDFSAVLSASSETDTSGQAGAHSMPQAALRRDPSQGDLRVTGEPENLALQGAGYFQVQGADGKPAYTRDGEFQRSATDALVTKNGMPVLGVGGEPLQFDAKKGEVVIGKDGRITQGTAEVGRIGVFTLDHATESQLGGGLFRPGAGTSATAVPVPVIQSGALESSNVSPLRSMVELIEVQRAYEANQKVISAHDQRLGSAIQILGNPQS